MKYDQDQNQISAQIQLQDGQKVEVTPEVKQAWYQTINSERYRARALGMCGQPNFTQCGGDCGLCCWHIPGRQLSLDDEAVREGAGLNALISPYMLPEEYVEVKDMLGIVLILAGEAAKDGAALFRLSALEGLSQREIARQLHLSQGAVSKRLRAVIAYLVAHQAVWRG